MNFFAKNRRLEKSPDHQFGRKVGPPQPVYKQGDKHFRMTGQLKIRDSP